MFPVFFYLWHVWIWESSQYKHYVDYHKRSNHCYFAYWSKILLVHWYSSRCILLISFFRFIFVISLRSVVNSTPSTINLSGFYSMLTSYWTMFSGGLTHPNHIHLVLLRFIFNPEKVLNLSSTEIHFKRASLEPSKKQGGIIWKSINFYFNFVNGVSFNIWILPYNANLGITLYIFLKWDGNRWVYFT